MHRTVHAAHLTECSLYSRLFHPRDKQRCQSQQGAQRPAAANQKGVAYEWWVENYWIGTREAGDRSTTPMNAQTLGKAFTRVSQPSSSRQAAGTTHLEGGEAVRLDDLPGVPDVHVSEVFVDEEDGVRSHLDDGCTHAQTPTHTHTHKKEWDGGGACVRRIEIAQGGEAKGAQSEG